MAALLALPCQAWAFDDTLYPDLTGQWTRADASPSFDPGKPPGRGQQAPLTAEYQAKFDAIVADRAKRQLTDVISTTCLAPGMPMMMQAYEPMQITVLPETTYILIDHIHETHRRIFTDGRSWPKTAEPTFTGFTIGKWIDTDGDGRFDVLEAETRHLKGPRFFDGSGIPLHEDNETVVRERIFLDKSDRNLLHDEITVTDHALTRPWTVTKSYKRNSDPLADWPEFICNERLPLRPPRRRGLPARRGWPAHPDPAGPAAAGPAILRTGEEMTALPDRRSHNSNGAPHEAQTPDRRRHPPRIALRRRSPSRSPSTRRNIRIGRAAGAASPSPASSASRPMIRRSAAARPRRRR